MPITGLSSSVFNAKVAPDWQPSCLMVLTGFRVFRVYVDALVSGSRT